MVGSHSAPAWWLATAFTAVLALAVATTADARPGMAAAPAQRSGLGDGGSDKSRPVESAEDAGPRYGAVDERFSTVRAGRKTVHSEHAHQREMVPTGQRGMVVTGEAGATNSVVLDPAIFGSWDQMSYNLPMRAIHATLLRTGKVLLIAGSGNQKSVFNAGSFTAGLLDPVTGDYKPVNPPYDMFCAGHAQLPNGNILIVGGTLDYPTTGEDLVATKNFLGINRIYEFDVAAEKWMARTSMAHGRWYPSSVESPAGDIWNFAGDNEYGQPNQQVERYRPSTGSVAQRPTWRLPKYPGLFWTAKNRVFYAGTRSGGAARQPGLYNPGTGAVQPVNGITSLDQRKGAAALFSGDVKAQRVLVVGGGWPATNTTSYIDLRATTPVGVAGPNLPTAKAYVGAVNLPTDGSVFETGGGTGRDTPVYESSIIRGNTVVPMAPNTVPRTYHSSTLLLPDGRIMTMGGDDYGDGFEMQVEVFTPPYLHNGARPVITAAPTRAAYNTTYNLSASSTDAELASAWLIRPASTTHSVDPNQRAVKLTASRITGGLRVTTPNKYVAPPGYYMLFVNDSEGRPSVARWIRISR